MKKCKYGGYCDPYKDANGVLRCKKCKEKIEGKNIDITPPGDEDPSTSYEEEHDL